MKRRVILFAGSSGIGKTTLAKKLEEDLLLAGEDTKFLSGSLSDLVPETKDRSHKDMLSRDVNELATEDYKLLNLRRNLIKYNLIETPIGDGLNFISDRSFLDSAAYFIYKQSKHIPTCEVEHFLELCKQLTNTYCTHLILLDFTPEMIKDWVVENNNKRITNKYFQIQISQLMKMVLDLWGVQFNRIDALYEGFWRNKVTSFENGGALVGDLKSLYGDTRVMVVQEGKLSDREILIKAFINGKI